MSIGTLFWLLIIIAVIFGLWGFYGGVAWYYYGNSFLLFVLICLLGWKVFGPPLRA